jgi:hypothetical protein
MNYPVELKWSEAAAIRLRRVKAGIPPNVEKAEFEKEETEVHATADPPGSERDQLPSRTVGLALSGGGIRCATFSLGVLQALAKKNRLRAIDILSSVSGGGYIGSFLGRLFTRGIIRDDEFDPCGRVEAILADNNSLQLRWLRTHANYIVGQGGSDVREHLAVLWRNLASIYFILAILGAALFGLLRMAGEWFRRSLSPPTVPAALGQRFAEAVSSWWWVPLAVLAVAIIPAFIAYWLAPKLGTRASFSFFPLVGWIILLLGFTASLALVGGLLLGVAGIVVVLLGIVWLEAARSHLPRKLDRSAGETSADPGAVIRNRLTRGMGEAVVILLVCLVWVVIDTLARGLAQGTIWKFMAAWGALLVPIAPFFRRWAMLLGAAGRKTKTDDNEPPGFFSSPGVRAGLISFPLAAFLLVVLDGGVHCIFIHDRSWGLTVTLLAIALSMVFGRAFDFLNYSSLQQSYASRLSRTFLGASNPARFRATSNETGRDVQVVHPDDDLAFAEYHPEENGGPLHLIGLCINETVEAASQRDIRDRKGLPMCVSPCGVSVGRRFHALWSRPPAKLPWRARLRCLLDGRAPIKGDCPTALRAIPAGSEVFHVFKGATDAPVAVEPLRVGTWIAISGAAFGTGTGRSTSLPVALLLGLVNLRLGYWWDSGLDRSERPGQPSGNFWRRLKSWPASLVRMQSLLLSDFQGRFGGPSHRFWNVSDGGHFDVTGIYELLRRRVPFIIAVDGSDDLKLTFGDCGELVRQARVDFGANVEFLDESGLKPDAIPEWIREWLNLDALGPVAKLGQPGGTHATLARVTFDGCCCCSWILLLKSSLTGDESLDIAAYKSNHPVFPAESTLDQFFDEAQWESYRMLGEHVGNAAVCR